jgi:CRISPR-associated protein Cmr2
MPKTYIGLTIGPIYSTFSRARHTREFWAVSYSFSLLAKFLMEEIHAQMNVPNEDFKLPSKVELDKAFKENEGIGLYPDQIIFIAPEKSWELVPSVIDKSYKRLADEMLKVPDLGFPSDALAALLKETLRVYAVKKDVESDKNPILELSNELNSAELNGKIAITDTGEKAMGVFFESVNRVSKDDPNKKKGNSFLRERFSWQKDVTGQVRIPSIIEISTVELAEKQQAAYKSLVVDNIFDDDNEKDSDGDFIRELKRYFDNRDENNPVKSFKSYHKYICILKADGDKIGKTLRNLKSDEEGDQFSAKLINWGKESLGLLKEYGALPIYIGGDDLLCFAPVANGDQTIFDLILKIRMKFLEQSFPRNYATLSFGLTISYYKHPMAEAMLQVDELLKEAKKIGGGDTAAVRLLKHSGSEFKLLMKMSDGELMQKHFAPICKSMVADSSFLNSVMYQIRENEETYKEIYGDGARIWNFICNNFDEAMRLKSNPDKPNAKGRYLAAVRELMIDSFKKHGLATEGDPTKGEQKGLIAIKEIYSLLRLARFIKGFEDADK